MSKIPLLQNKETIIGISLFGGAFILFIINMIVTVLILIQVYGAKQTVNSNTAIDGTVLSEAIQVISPQ